MLKRLKTLLAAIGALSLILFAFLAVRSCDDADPSANLRPRELLPTSTIASSGSPTLDKILQRKRLVVVLPTDHPGLSANRPPTGFDVEIARIVAGGLGLPENAVSFKPLLRPDIIADGLTSGDWDLAIGALVIGQQPLEMSDPYLATSVDVLVPAAAAAADVAALAGTPVCSVASTGDADRLRARAPGAQLTEAESLRQCLSRLRGGQAGAIVADDGLLRGVAATEPGRYRLLGARLAESAGYGIALPEGDGVLRSKINEILAAAAASGRWQSAYNTTLARSGVPATPPT